MRKHFIDQVRWIAVLFLFPYHTARIFDGIHPFYIKGAETGAATAFVLCCTPWFMPLLFAVAGISARYALQKRTTRAFIRERGRKLLVPFVLGVLLLVPVQTYFAERFHNGYIGGYWSQYLLFFTKETDFSGYTGGFTPGQLWFIWYLFVISLATLPLIRLAEQGKRRDTPVWLVLPLGLVTLPLSYVLDIGGKSLGEYTALFLLGYFLLAEEDVQVFLDRRRVPLTLAGGLLTVYTAVFQTSLKEGIAHRGIMILTSWLCILAILGMGRRYLNIQTWWTDRLSAASFSFYLFHQSWIVLIGYYVLRRQWPAGLQYGLILAGSLLGCVLTAELCRGGRYIRASLSAAYQRFHVWR